MNDQVETPQARSTTIGILTMLWLVGLSMHALIGGVRGSEYQMAPAAAPSPAKPIPNDSVSQLLDLSVPGLNFLQRFTAACWQMTKTWFENEGEEPGSDPWPTSPLERVVIGQRFYSAGMKSYLEHDWNAVSENLGSSLHLQLYPYVKSGQAMRAWHRHLASNDIDALAMRLWIGRLLLIYGKNQLGWAKYINGIHAADMCYLSANAAVGILHSLKKINPERPFSEEGLRILFPGEAPETIGNIDDALHLRNECASTLVDIVVARQGDATSLYNALLPRGVTFNPIRNPGDFLHQLQKVLYTPIKVFSNCCSGPMNSGGGGGEGGGACHFSGDSEDDVDISDNPHEEVTNSITVEIDEVRMNKEATQLVKLKPIKALHHAAIVAAHGNRDWFRKEVGIDCWDHVTNTSNMRKCREAVEWLWTTEWKKDDTEIEPTPASLMKAMHLVQFATWHANQVLYGTSVGMRHAVDEVILSNTGFQWVLMEYFYKEKLQAGNGEETIRRIIQQAVPLRPAVGTVPHSPPVPCIDFSLLQNSLLQLHEGALRDLLTALKGLARAQVSVGGPETFWPLVQLHNGAVVTYQNSNGDTAGNRPENQTLTPSEFHNVVAAIIEATNHNHLLNTAANNNKNKNNNAGHSSSGAIYSGSSKAAKSLLDKEEELWNTGALSVFGQGLGIPPPKPISMHRRGVKALSGLFFISFDDGVVVLVLLLCLICGVSLYRALLHMFGWGIKSSNRALNRSGIGRGGSGGGVSRGRSIPSHSAWIIAQRNTAASGLREAIASESIPRLTAAVKQAEEAGVEKPLVKKGKERLQHSKKRKVAAIGTGTGGGGGVGGGLPSAVATAYISGGSTSAPNSKPLSKSTPGGGSSTKAALSTSSASTGVAAMRLLTKGQHTPANSGDQASTEWAKEDEWVVVSPKTQAYHGNHHKQQQQEQGNQYSTLPVGEPTSQTGVEETLEKKKDVAATPGTPVRQPLPPSSQFGERASEESQQGVLSSQQRQEEQQQQPSTPSPLQPRPSKFATPSPTAAPLVSSSTLLGGGGGGGGSVAKSTPVAKKAAAAAAPWARMQQQQPRGTNAQLFPSASSVSSLSTSTSEMEISSFSPELRQTRSLPPSYVAADRPCGSHGAASTTTTTAVVVTQPVAQPVPRCASAPSRGARNLQGVEMEKPEMVHGKQAPNIVLVKRSSLQQRPSQAAAAPGEDAGQKWTAANKKFAPKAATPFSGRTAAFAPPTSKGAASQQQLPVLTFGTPVNSPPPDPLAASLKPTMYGSAAQLLSTDAGRSSFPTTTAENEARKREISSFLLAQAQANWSPSAASAEVAAAAYAAAKASSSVCYDDIGYTDAWASVGQHFSNTSPSASYATPITTTVGALPLSPSFGGATAAGFGALSPSSAFDARLSTVLSTETSLGLSLLPADASLSGGLSGRTTSSVPSGTGELLASLQQIWEGPPSAEESLTPCSSQSTTPHATSLSAGGAGGANALSPSPLGELLPSAGLTRLASLSSASGQHEALQWLGIDNNNTCDDEFYHRRASLNVASSSSLSFQGNHRAHNSSLADLGFEESSEV
ncbi:hypothetical protein NADE_002936 [Nannochloris sp. 'desiccata']|nr:hypothetical protein NADE_002936 [Chlorella desiccata (nom. nud.)]